MSARPPRLRLEPLESRCLLAVFGFDSAAYATDTTSGVSLPPASAIVTEDDGCGDHATVGTTLTSPSVAPAANSLTSVATSTQGVSPDYAALYSAMNHGSIGGGESDGGDHEGMAADELSAHEMGELYGEAGSSLLQLHSQNTYHGSVGDDRAAISHVDMISSGGRGMNDGRAADMAIAGTFGNAIDEASPEFALAGGGMIGGENSADAMPMIAGTEGAAKNMHNGENPEAGESVDALVAGWSHFDLASPTTLADAAPQSIEPAVQVAAEAPVTETLVQATDAAFADPHLVLAPINEAKPQESARATWPAVTAAVLAVASSISAFLLERRARKSLTTTMRRSGVLSNDQRVDEAHQPVRTSPQRSRRMPTALRAGRAMSIVR